MQMTKAQQRNEIEILELQEKLRIATVKQSEFAAMSKAEILGDILHEEACEDHYCNWKSDTIPREEHRAEFLAVAEELLTLADTKTVLEIFELTRYL